MDDRGYSQETGSYGPPRDLGQGLGSGRGSARGEGPPQDQGPFGGSPQMRGERVRVEMTRDDFKILRECNRESFYMRCLPLIVASNAGLYYYSKSRGPGKGVKWFPYFGATLGAWFVGKIMYRSICEEKLMASNSNSAFVQLVRKKRGKVGEVEDKWAVSDAVGFKDQPQHRLALQEGREEKSDLSDMFNSPLEEKRAFETTDEREADTSRRSRSTATYADLRDNNRSQLQYQPAFRRPASDYPSPRPDPGAGAEGRVEDKGGRFSF